MGKMETVLMYFLNKKILSRTEVIKYLYLYEYIYLGLTGETGTGLTFIRWNHGPFNQSIYDTLGSLEHSGDIICVKSRNDYNSLTYRYEAKSHTLVLTTVQQYVADYVIQELSPRSFNGMIEYIYLTRPMVKILSAEYLGGEKLLGEVLLMNETNGVYKRTRIGREGAIKRSREAERERGTDQEYLSASLHEYKLHETLRGRAKSVSQRFDSR